MSALTPDQRRTRARVETLIRLVAPGLNAVLAVGERISRVVESEDSEYYPVRAVVGDADAPAGASDARR